LVMEEMEIVENGEDLDSLKRAALTQRKKK
jgi:hypothetical protein